MVKMEAFRSYFSEVSDVQVQADGYGLHLFWQDSVNPVVMQTLEDYGGFKLAEREGQALWFFFSPDVLVAVARLGVWSRFNPLALGLQIFPARMIKSHGDDKQLIMDETFWTEEISAPSTFRIWVNMSMLNIVETSPGLSLQLYPEDKQLDPIIWPILEVDSRLPYQSPLSWVAVLYPVESSQNKSFHLSWREFVSHLESLLQRNKFRFSLKNNFLMFSIETLRQLKTWCKDYFSLLERLKVENPDQYWPSVMAIVDRKGMTINEDLPGKIGVEWEYLVPDYPHMSMRNALMLGSGFNAHEARFAPVRHHPDDWVSVSKRDEESDASSATLPQIVPRSVLFGHHPLCFYCGQRSHAVSECPSRGIDPTSQSVWPEVARLDFNAMRSSVARIDEHVGGMPDEKAKIAALSSLLQENSQATVMLKAFYDHTWPVQLRAVNFFWRARNKDLQKAADTLAAVDSSYFWDLLSAFRSKDSQAIDEELKQLQMKFSADFRLHSLRGFWAVERGELHKAEKFWKEAERLSPHPIVQFWHIFLQARVLECLGFFSQASILYDQVARTCPTWHDAEYRKLVCMVKSGFIGGALSALAALIDKSGHFFNRALIDPELERGYIQVLARLCGMWNSMAARAGEETANLTRIRDELDIWFQPGNAFATTIAERVNKVLERSHVENYVAFQMLVHGRARIERDVQAHVLAKSREYKERFKANGVQLRRIHEESAWFPFPKTLVEFNRSYNEGVANTNWALTTNLHTPEAFRKAQILVEQEAERIGKLEGRLKFLRIVRDSTLFLLVMAETFLWLQIIGLILIFAVLPLLIFYGDKIGLEFLATILAKERWPIQKAMLMVLTVLALGVASFRTLLRFETIRDKLLTKAQTGQVQSGKLK